MSTHPQSPLSTMKDRNTAQPWTMAPVIALLLFGGAADAQTHQDIHLGNGSVLRIPLAEIDSMGFYPAGYATPLAVTTGAATVVTATTAQVGGALVAGGPCERGICWSTTPGPTVADMVVPAGAGSGAFSCGLTGLAGNTLYHVRAYATNTNGTVYGSDISFTTDISSFQPGDAVTDAQGNSYATIWIGGMHWMAENLRSVTFANGDPIPNVTADNTWESISTPAWCSFNNSPANAATYGRLYNGFAVVDPRNVCPAGWHVASDVELFALIEAIDTVDYEEGMVSPRAGGKMKATGGVVWQYPNNGASDQSGFHALGAGYRNDGNSAFWNLLQQSYFWALSADLPGQTCTYSLYYDHGGIQFTGPNMPGRLGHSVRCVAD